ncbi:MAG: hypothetical protein ACI8WM_002666 [Burkholderiaceae bacterium]|jgi:hypothetical protein
MPLPGSDRDQGLTDGIQDHISEEREEIRMFFYPVLTRFGCRV